MVRQRCVVVSLEYNFIFYFVSLNYLRFELLDYWKRFSEDGLNSLSKLNYTIKSITNDYL